MITLNVNTPGDVSSVQLLDVVTNEPGVKLYIFTGISLPRMYNEDERVLFWTNSRNRHELIEVTLNRVPGHMIASAAQVSLARIWSHPGLFNFHLTEVWVEQRDSGEIILKYRADMNGTAGLVGVSYQVNAKILELQTEIRGIVRWQEPHIEATRESELLDIHANRVGEARPSVVGSVERAPLMVGNFMQVPFVIQNPPLGVPLRVVVSARSGAFLAGGRPSEAIAANQVGGPSPVMVTLTEPRRSDLVFELYEIG
jgi:hypothetical protein